METRKSQFIVDFGENYSAASEICDTMIDSRNLDDEVCFGVFCLEQKEFDDILNYDPFHS